MVKNQLYQSVDTHGILVGSGKESLEKSQLSEDFVDMMPKIPRSIHFRNYLNKSIDVAKMRLPPGKVMRLK